MKKDTKINLVLTVWLLIALYGVKSVYELALGSMSNADALLVSVFPSIPTLLLAIVLSIRLTK